MSPADIDWEFYHARLDGLPAYGKIIFLNSLSASCFIDLHTALLERV